MAKLSSIEDQSARPIPALRNRFRWLWIILAALPFWALYVQHFLQPNPTGFLQYDQPYYVANGREVFERGNGFSHPNPYDPAPDAPCIYFHWLTWLFGAAVTFGHVDPVVPELIALVVGGLLTSWLTLLLVEHRLPDRRFQTMFFLMAMWGGGAFVLRGLIRTGIPPRLHDLYAYDPGDGWWFLNWGRNLLLPTEAIYHALVAATWLLVLKRQETAAILLCGVLAATHPFSGLQLMLGLGLWLTLRVVLNRTRIATIRWLLWAGIAAVFGWYYFVFLNQFPQHRALQANWVSTPEVWNLSWRAMVLAYAPVGMMALIALMAFRPWTRETAFLLVCAVVTAVLIKHDWITAHPHQPIHFTRGYEWLPLFLLSLPMWQAVLCWLADRLPKLVQPIVALIVLAFFCLDNATFLLATSRESLAAPQHLTLDQREMFHWMQAHQLDGVLLTPEPAAAYLSAVYTPARPFVGHLFNTPEYARRSSQMMEFLRDPSANSDLQIDLVLLPRTWANEWPAVLSNSTVANQWKVLHENPSAVLFSRQRVDAVPP